MAGQPLTPEHAADRIAQTREAASAFVEDLQYMRRLVISSQTDTGEIRRLSASLRRILIDGGGDLSAVAAPRIGKFELLVQDLNKFYKSEEVEKFGFFLSGNVQIFGKYFSVIRLQRRGTIVNLAFNMRSANHTHQFEAPVANEDYRVSCIFLKLESFLRQRVMYCDNHWYTRFDVLRFAANIAYGVHSGATRSSLEERLLLIRNVVRIGVVAPDVIGVAFDSRALEEITDAFQVRPQTLDPIFVEVLATARFLTLSPDLDKLEKIILEELR